MTDEKAPRLPVFKNRSPVFGLGAVVVVVVVVGLLSWWTGVVTDRGMRSDLLRQTRFVAQALNADTIKKLSGTSADLDSPDYNNLKELLSGIRSADPQCRFLYLMGRKADRTVFFYVDSETPKSKDYSPPGQVYKEATANLHRVFDGHTQLVEGPVRDAWGVWVSSLVPITDPKTGQVIAVLGEDIDASVWKWDVAAKVAWPVALMLLLGIIVVSRLLAVRKHTHESTRPIVRLLLLPLTAMLVLMMVGAGVLLWWKDHQNLERMIATDIYDIAGDLRVAQDMENVGLNAAAKTISLDAATQRALSAGDAGSLLNTWKPVFEILKKENEITHLYFLDKKRICLLRVHKPEMRGDRVDRFTALEAERTGRSSSGLELGPLGLLTVRVVQPVFENGALVGYVELGRELDGVLKKLSLRSSCQLAVLIGKEHLDRKGWEEGMRLLRKEAQWDRLPKSVVSFDPKGRMSRALLDKIDKAAAGGSVRGSWTLKIADSGRDWGVGVNPLKDASGKEIGELIAMRDITAENAALRRLLILGGASCAVLLMFLVGFLYVLLVRTERSLFGQQAKMLLLAKLMAVEEVGSGVANEMSQPLTAVSAYLESLRMDPEIGVSEQLDVKLRKIMDGFTRIRNITERMQDYVGTRPEDFFLDDVNRPARDGFYILRQQIKTNNIVVRENLAEGLPKVLINRYQIQDVVIGLLTHAWDAVEERFGANGGGEMTLFSKELKSCGAVLVGVIDNGKPIKKGTEDNIFYPLPAAKGSGRSAGLGFSASEGILKAHGGRLAFAPLSGERNLFYFVLPDEKCPALSDQNALLGEDIKELLISL